MSPRLKQKVHVPKRRGPVNVLGGVAMKPKEKPKQGHDEALEVAKRCLCAKNETAACNLPGRKDKPISLAIYHHDPRNKRNTN